MQRALAHAYLHQHAPLPTLRLSLGFMTSTARTTEEVDGLGHRMSVLGVARAEHTAYVVEELGAGEPPIAYRLYTSGARAGHLVPIAAWYENDPEEEAVRARIAKLAATLEPCAKTTTEAWMLSTRIVQRRALRVAGQDAPIRKFALQLRVEPVSGMGATGATTVTAFLRPDARLIDVMAIPGEAGMLARVAFTGVPSGLGLVKETVILLSE
ncbi:MAG: hypothetical protein ABI678_19060 [Kofleriaceae bacterium]